MSIFEIKEFKLRKCQKRKPVCTMCKQAFSWTEKTAHWKKKHGGQDENKCKKCDKVTHSLAQKACLPAPGRQRKAQMFCMQAKIQF